MGLSEMLKMSHRPPPIPSAMVHSRGEGGGGGDEGGGGGGERQGGGRGGEDLNQSGQSALGSSLNLSTADIPQVQVTHSAMSSCADSFIYLSSEAWKDT